MSAGTQPEAFAPLTSKTNLKDIMPRLEARASQPDVWAEQWPDDPKLLAIRDRLSRYLRYSCGWPSVFFVPGDALNVLIDQADDDLDLVELVMDIENMFDIKFTSEGLMEISRSSYQCFLEGLLRLTKPEGDLLGHNYLWEPLCLPGDYYKKQFEGQAKKSKWLRFFYNPDKSRHRELRRQQALRPLTWAGQWPREAALIQLRDRISRILVERLQWLDEAFIPQDHLDAMCHSRHGFQLIPVVLKEINREMKSDVDLEFIVVGEHTFEDLLQRLGKGVGRKFEWTVPDTPNDENQTE